MSDSQQTFNKSHILQRGLILFGLLLLLAACRSSAFQPQPTQARTLALSRCPAQAINQALPGRSECGTLTVYEDREASSGRTIDLNIVFIPAVSRSPEPDPIFFIAGGPGQSAVDTFPLLYAVFTQINQKREIILVDQRGTGRSNPLDCPAGEEDLDPDEELEAWLKHCLDELDADPTLYTTSIAMQDLDQVREALGYQQINLYGVSYGTRAALTYLRMYPERVRSMVLDGVVPQDLVLGESTARDAQQALDKVFALCQSDPTCAQSFPNLPEAFQSLLAALEAEPVEVTLPHPATGRTETLRFTREMMAGAVRLLSYAPETNALLPLLIHSSYEKEDYSLLAAQYLMVASQLETGIAEGMSYSILCAEDEPFIDPQAARASNAGAYLGDQQTDQLQKVCSLWPRGEIPGWFKEPVASEVPALLLSGELDPVTPPAFAEQAARTLPNSLHLVARGQGHNIIYRGCIPTLVGNFIDSGSAAGLNIDCVNNLSGAQFFIDFTGPIP